jgi:DNA-binding CsgD family transcriptional regulator
MSRRCNLASSIAVRRAAGLRRRKRILRMLAKGPMSTGQLAEAEQCARPSIVWHLRILREQNRIRPGGWAKNESTGRDWCVWVLR